ncbi:papain family cysteine protease [Teladorsagia circumcincta]|uniref:Papain family cysteine protease n=1 Tax=Teladorsagia circumcincta TaxID=45464 RepID=A0A2G9V3C9_TELCI|nr:papain family cysteine protease [Teladorsagia circumcincta]
MMSCHPADGHELTAVAAAGVASDRACIKSNGTFRASLSEEDVLGCCAVCGNCYGGDPLKALVYWVNEGIVTGGRDGCRPYSFDRSCGVPCSPATFFGAEKNRICVRRCQDIYYQNKYDEDKHYGVFQPYPLEDFDKRIIYWHVVRLIGWGQAEDGSHYWTAINSFGEHWGDSGVFKINADWMEKYGLEYEAALV